MRGLTLWQPYASAIQTGAKRYETRSWSTRYRGPLLIHAAQRWLPLAEALALFVPPDYGCAPPADVLLWRKAFRLPPLSNPEQDRRLVKEFQEGLPRGAVVAVCHLRDCQPVEAVRDRLAPLELAMGNYADGRFAYELTNLVPLDEPWYCPGTHRLWRASGEFRMLQQVRGLNLEALAQPDFLPGLSEPDAAGELFP